MRHHGAVRRVSVVGTAGSGKTALAGRIAAVLGVPHVELDAIHHRSGWKPIEAEEFLAQVRAVADTDGWVIDGNYRAVVMEGPVWERADTVVWLDLPRSTVMRQVTWRTLSRAVRREELWNGNREPLSSLFVWDTSRSIIGWAWAQHPVHRERYASAMTAPRYAHLDFVRLRSHAAAERWLAGVTPG